MRRRGSWVILAGWLFCASLWAATPTLAPDADDAQAARALDQILSNPELTYSSRAQDQLFLSGVIDRYLDTLDPSRLVFTAQDEAKFKQDPRWVRAALQGRALAAPLRIFEIYRDRFDTAMARAVAQVSHPAPAFPAGARWQADRTQAERPIAGKAWEQLWAASVQNDRLSLLAAGHPAARVDADLARRYKQAGTLVKEFDKDRVIDLFLDAYARSFDPHSNYFPPARAAEFASALSLQLDGIGVVFSREDTGVIVKEVVKTGPAAKAGVATGDRLSAFGPDETSLRSVEGVDMDTLVANIRGKKGTVVVLELVRKATGKLERIKVVRDTVQINEDQKVKWHMIQETDQPKVAVISLPIFYHDFQSPVGKGNSATQDVERALAEAAKQGAQSVVLDLSGNGGGSLVEAVNLVGLFTPPSPVVQVRSPEGEVQIIKSERALPAWTGPLAVLIDSNSASASEIVAAALQDLGRAVVVGERSYGKGTVQTLVDLDRATALPSGKIGQVKLTTAQFFRPSGVSTQLLGVIPDVELGSAAVPAGERAYANALPSASVPPAVPPVSLLNASQKVALSAASKTRQPRSIFPVSPPFVALNASARQSQENKRLTAEVARQQALRKRWPEEAARVLTQASTAKLDPTP